MPPKARSADRDQKSFDDWWSKHLFFAKDPRHSIYKRIYLKGADLDFIDCLTRCLLFADSLNVWRNEVGARRKSERVATKGKLREGIETQSLFALDRVNYNRQYGSKDSFSPGMRENLRALMLIAYSVNPEDFRAGGKSDRCGSFFLLVVTRHFQEKGVKPRNLLAAELLKKIRDQSFTKSHQEATQVKTRVEQFKRHTHDWQFRLNQFMENLHHLGTT
jgi:hypothetical protein